MSRLAVRLACAVLAALPSGGCYLSHGREARPDAGRARDAGAADAGTDSGPRDGGPDAGPPSCDALRIAEVVALDDVTAGVTPRLVALPGGEIGAVHARTGGDGIAIGYHRLSADLTVRGASTVARDARSWADAVMLGDTLLVAYALSRSSSRLQPITVEGAPLGAGAVLPFENPSVLLPRGGGLFWMAFAMRTDNALRIHHIDASGAFGAPVEIELGRYGSGHGAVGVPGGDATVIAYPREGPRGVRRAYVRRVEATGALGPERMLDEAGDQLAIPTWLGEALIVVHHGDALILSERDPDTLEEIRQARFEARDSRPFFVGQLAGWLLVGHVTSGELRLDVFDGALAERDRLVLRVPGGRVNGPSGSVLSLRDAVYVGVGVVNGSDSFPAVARILCAP